MSIYDTVVSRLKSEYGFEPDGEWLRKGKCPSCGKKEAYTHAHTPKVIKCPRADKCGAEFHVKDLFPELFKDWSKTYQRTPQNPNAAADAYLSEGRDLNITKLKGHYSQDNYFDRELNIGSATVRFTLASGDWWERLIDRPERFKRKANFKYGSSLNGTWWWHPANEKMPKEIWITEGIFDACALAEHGLNTASSMSSGFFPENALYDLKSQYDQARHRLPILVWAYDNGKAGFDGIKKSVEKATKMGFTCRAALPPYDKHAKLDWNDLHQKKQINPKAIEKFRYYGDLFLAPTAIDAAVIRYMHSEHSSFYFEHNYRTYWFELDTAKLAKLMEEAKRDVEDTMKKVLKEECIKIDDTKLRQFVQQTSHVREIFNAKLEALYFQRNEITDESWYFTRVTTAGGSKQTTITGDHLSSPSKLKPRLLSVFAGALFTGSAMHLDMIVKHEMEGLKEVKTTDFIGYAKEHNAYIFNKVAFSKGKVVQKNEQDYFKFGILELKSLANDPVFEINIKDKPDFSWWHNFYQVRGNYGTIVLAWWLGSYFAEQIRAMDSSYPFFELVGQAGAGKSRLLEFLWKLTGRTDHYEGFNPSKATSVGVYRNFAQVSNMPIALIEGDRNDDEGKKSVQPFDWDSLKDAFNGRSIRSRGVKNNGNDTYSPPFRAAVMISQNEEIQASEAMLTRIIHVKINRDGQTLETKKLVDELDRLPLDVTSRFLAHALTHEADIMAKYANQVRQYEEQYHMAGITHTRIALNHAQIAAMIDCLYLVMLPNQMTMEQAMQAKFLLMDMAKARVLRLQADHPDVEKFWGVYEFLQLNQWQKVNHIAEEEPIVGINLNHFYKLARQQHQDLPDVNTMKRLLENSGRYKFIDSNVSRRSCIKGQGFENIKCWVFQKPKN